MEEYYLFLRDHKYNNGGYESASYTNQVNCVGQTSVQHRR